MEEVVLDEYVDDSFAEHLRSKMVYPCVLLGGITSNEEIEFFRNRKTDEDVSVTAYCMVDGEPINLGQIELTLNGLLFLRSIFPYEVQLCISEEKFVKIDLNDPKDLMRYIRL